MVVYMLGRAPPHMSAVSKIKEQRQDKQHVISSTHLSLTKIAQIAMLLVSLAEKLPMLLLEKVVQMSHEEKVMHLGFFS